VDENDVLAQRFEQQRGQLRAVAYRMLGSLSEADDAVQEAWLRLSRTDTSDVANLAGWLTTVVGRICLDMLRSRRSRREESLDVTVHVPDPVISWGDEVDPEHEAVLADSVGLALLVVLETLSPAERLAFVLHDLFAVPFEQIATIVGRSPDATKMLASRARRRVRDGGREPDGDPARRREVVDAFLAAARDGDFDGLLAVLDPDVTLRADVGADATGLSSLVRGAADVAGRALMFSRFAQFGRRALVNGAPGVVNVVDGKVQAVLAFTVAGGRIVAIDVLADAARLARLELPPPAL
jgi:RNA polymerase sigma-70 factor (ECF subfamily)